MSGLEEIILSNILYSDSFTRKTIPYLKEEYFTDTSEQIAFNLINAHITKYNSIPSKKELIVELDALELVDATHEQAKSYVEALGKSNIIENEQWLLDQTEKFCQERAVYNALVKSLEIYNDKSGKTSMGAIPDLLTGALAVSFDTNLGHDYIEDAEQRYDTLHEKQKRIRFHIDFLNKITKGGLKPKTLNCLLASTGVGKSLFMCDLAAHHLEAGYNVLYLTMEMSEEDIGNRIDANLCNLDIGDLAEIDKPKFMGLIANVKSKVKGKLKIKEYPNGSASAAHFRYHINELALKEQFVPDIIYVDYLNICASSRLKIGNVNSYQYIKSISEELRALAQELGLPIVTATQTNRDGAENSDVGMKETSDSFGLPMTLDLFLAIMQPTEFIEKGQYLVKQLKNRYNDVNYMNKFIIGVDKGKMRLYDVEDMAQEDLLDGPVMDTTPSFIKNRESKKSFDDWT